MYAVNSGKAWGALYVPPNYSQSLVSTTPLSIQQIFGVIANPGAFLAAFNQIGRDPFPTHSHLGHSHSPTHSHLGQNETAVDFIYDEGRCQNTVQILLVVIQTIFDQLNAQVRTLILSGQFGNALVGFLSPTYLQQPFRVNYVNLHEVVRTGENFAR